MVFHSDYGQSRRGRQKMPPPMAQDAFERVIAGRVKNLQS